MEQAVSTTSDVDVIGVLPSFHDQGIGRLLIHTLAKRAKSDGAHFLEVKTLSSSLQDPFYGRIRYFHEAVGFAPLARLPEYWDPRTPVF